MCGTEQSKPSKPSENLDFKQHQALRESPFMKYANGREGTKNVGDIMIQETSQPQFTHTGQFSKVNFTPFHTRLKSQISSSRIFFSIEIFNIYKDFRQNLFFQFN